MQFSLVLCMSYLNSIDRVYRYCHLFQLILCIYLNHFIIFCLCFIGKPNLLRICLLTLNHHFNQKNHNQSQSHFQLALRSIFFVRLPKIIYLLPIIIEVNFIFSFLHSRLSSFMSYCNSFSASVSNRKCVEGGRLLIFHWKYISFFFFFLIPFFLN